MTCRRPRLRWSLVAANLAACALFVVLREPASQHYLHDVDAARQRGGILLDSGITGMLACRLVYSWDEWHGGESFGVKALEVANAPALVATIAVGVFGEVGLARQFSACGWSWLLAGVFITAASVQWWILGVVLEYLPRLARRRLGNG